MLKSVPDWLRANVTGPRVGVDRAHGIILGYVVAQEGRCLESGPRVEFDTKSLGEILRLMKAKPTGLKVRFTHPSLSGDGLGTFLGRAKNPRLDTVSVERDGETVELQAVRA